MGAPERIRTEQLRGGGALDRAHSLRRIHLTVFAVATIAALAHTVDEVRIGELIAVPFAAANLAVAVAWPRLGWRWQAAAALGFGLFWGLAVIPYHVAPLLAGVVTWQHVSGLTRVVAGLLMVALFVSLVVERRRASASTALP